MVHVSRIRGRWQRLVNSLPGAKGRGEIAYWRRKVAEEGTLKNDHYEFLYTTHWDIDPRVYVGAKVLDIGCGPRGSLEWADQAAERVGIDSLAKQYRSLGTERHGMKYVACGIEAAPFPDGHFDIVASINSLDHVDDLNMTIKQIKRLVRSGGRFLLLVEVNHAPTVCEPITLSWDVVEQFRPEFEIQRVRHYENSGGTMTETINGTLYNHHDPTPRVGTLSALMVRV